MHVSQPIGFGKESVTFDRLVDMSDAQLTFGALSQNANEDIPATVPEIITIPVIKKSFRINYRKQLGSLTYGTPLDLYALRQAAYKVALFENGVCLNGWKPTKTSTDYKVKGLYQAAGLDYNGADDWATNPNSIKTSLQGAIGMMIKKEIYAPYNLVVKPTEAIALSANMEGTSTTWRSYVTAEYLQGGSIYIDNSGMTGTGMLIAAGNRGFFEIKLGLDTTSELQMLDLMQGKDFYGLVYEALTPIIYEPNAICRLSAIGTPSP
jgi:uncharacterized linocin/CFP29 family protein